MDLDSSGERRFGAEPARTDQHFFPFLDDCPRGLLETENFGKLFFNFFAEIPDFDQSPTFRNGKSAS